MSDRKGDWAQTYTGKQFWPLDPSAEDVDIVDIAHGLSNLCRFNGHCRSFYSVAQHSVLVSRIVNDSQALPGLLHDASESYTGDLVSPLKRNLPPEFKSIEKEIERIIFEHFGIEINGIDYQEIKRADKVVLVTEMRDVMGKPPKKWNEDGLFAPMEEKIIPLSPEEAEQLFLRRYQELTR
jgi:hypothetical protein